MSYPRKMMTAELMKLIGFFGGERGII